MKKIQYLIILLTANLAINSCEENNGDDRPKGEVTISSEILGTNVYYVNGFSFEEEEYVPSLNSGSDVPDIIPENILEVSGEVIGMALSAGPGNPYGFYKNFESNNIAEAEEFYDNYTEAEAVNFSSLSDTLEAGQVYTFRTYKDNFVKFLVKDVRLESGGTLTGHAEADLKYSIQRDGTAIFEE
jgi:hypothetical protein